MYNIDTINQLSDYQRYKEFSGITAVTPDDISGATSYEGMQSWLRWHIPGAVKIQQIMAAGVKIPFWNDDVIEAETITVDDSSMPVEFCVGDSYIITVSVEPEDSNETVKFSSSDDEVLKVEKVSNNSVKVTPLKVGVASLSMTTSQVKESKEISVDVVLLKSISIKESSFTLDSGSYAILTPVLTPTTTTENTITWSVSDSTLATVDENGVVTANTDGYYGEVTATAYVDARSGKIEASCVGYVNPVDVIYVETTPETIIFTPNEDGTYDDIDITYTISPVNASFKDMTLVGDENVGSLYNIDGMTLSANMDALIGQGLVTVECGPVYTRTVGVEVKEVVASKLTVDKEVVTLDSGSYTYISLEVTPINTYNKTVTTSVSDTTLIDVSDDYRIQANSLGYAGDSVITFSCGNASASTTVTVNPVEAESVDVEVTKYFAKVGDKYKVSGIVSPENTTSKTITYTSSDESVATVTKDGDVEVVGEGTSYIKVACGEAYAQVEVCSIEEEMFYIENMTSEDGEIKLTGDKAPTITISYFVNGVTSDWMTLEDQSESFTLPLKANGRTFIKTSSQLALSDEQYWNIVPTVDVSLHGDMKALNGGSDTITANYAFAGLFFKAEHIKDASDLTISMTTLTDYCYYYLFAESGLVSGPKLPATTMKSHCYYRMFTECTSLVDAPALPATELNDYCYAYMFVDCLSMIKAPELPAMTMADNCYSFMFFGCAALQEAPELPATKLESYCYSSMLQKCTSLTKSPVLVATELAKYCYISMFNGCTGLKEITCLATTNVKETNTLNWVKGIDAEGVFYKADGVTWASGINGVPEGWTTQVYA